MGKYRAYESYKNSGVEWLGDIPEHWNINKIKRTVNIFGRIGFRGYTTADIVSEGEGAITLSPSNIIDGKINYSNRTYLSWGKYYESPEIQIFNKDILFVKTGSTIGKVAIVENMPESMTINPQLVVLKEIACHSEFLAYLMNADFYQFQVMGFRFGGSTPAMTQESLGQTQVILPPLEEQKAIARFLDYKTNQIDALIAKKEALLEKLDEKRTSLISHAVTKGLDATVPMKDSGIEWLGEIPDHWEVSKAKFVSVIFVPQRNKPELNSDEGLPWLTMDDMCGDRVLNTSFKVTKEASIQAGSKCLPMGSIVASCVGNFGICAINDVDVIINQQLQAFIPNEKIIPEYLCELVRISKDYFQMIATAATVVYVNQSGFANMPILIPCIKEQVKIVSFVNKKKKEIDRQKAKIQQAIDLLKEYRTALITNAVTGKIDVRQVPISNSP